MKDKVEQYKDFIKENLQGTQLTAASISQIVGTGNIISRLNDDKTNHLTALDEIAKVFSTIPYTAAITVPGDNKIYLSTSKDIAEKIVPLKTHLSNWLLSNDPNMKVTLYKTIFEQKNPLFDNIIKSKRNALRELQNKGDITLSEDINLFDNIIKHGMSDEIAQSKIFKDFVISDSTLDHIKLKNLSQSHPEISIISTGNEVHTEMGGVLALRRQDSSRKDFSVGLARNQLHGSCCCAGCTAEIKALEQDGIKINVSSLGLENIPPPPGVYRVSSNTLESNNPNVLKTFIESIASTLEAIGSKDIKEFEHLNLNSKLKEQLGSSITYAKKLHRDIQNSVNDIENIKNKDKELDNKEERKETTLKTTTLTYSQKEAEKKDKQTENPLKEKNDTRYSEEVKTLPDSILKQAKSIGEKANSPSSSTAKVTKAETVIPQNFNKKNNTGWSKK